MFDVLTVAAVADELTDRILDGRVQRVGMLSRWSVGLEIYAEGRRRYLVASAEHEDARLLLLDREPSFDSQLVTPLLLLLRKYVRGGIIVGIEQPPLDRVVRVSIAKRLEPHNSRGDGPGSDRSDDNGDDGEDANGLEGANFVHLMVEIMGRHSNIILVEDNGRIMDAAKRVTPAMSRVRPIAPKLAYVDPPAGERADPRKLSSAQTTMLLASEPPRTKLAAVLPRRLRGVSPQMAREVAFRALGSADVTVAEAGNEEHAAIAREMRRLLEPILTSAWSPVAYLDADRAPVAFAAIPHAYLADRYGEQTMESMSRAADLASGADETTSPWKHTQHRGRLEQAIQDAIGRVEARLARLRAEATKASDAERLRRWGETIYGYLWSMQPGQTMLEIDGETIPLDPGLSGKENAQHYFELYRKAQSAGTHVPKLVSETETELEYLRQLFTQVEQAETFPELEDLAAEWDGFQHRRDRGQRPARRSRSTPPRRTKAMLDRNGNSIYIGRSGTENDRITFDIAGPNDTWLHARGVPGSHVIVRWGNPTGDEDDDTLETAASLAAYYSQSRESGSVEVDITRRRHVRKIKGTGPGMVTYRNERTLAVRPASEEQLSSRFP